MLVPIYAPVLPVRRGAWNAYADLDDQVRQRIAPLWTLVPYAARERARGESPAPDTAADPTALDRWLTDRADHLVEATAGLPGWVDAAHVESGIDGSGAGLWRLMTRSHLRMVTGPERHPVLQRYAADLAFLTGRGMGIRVLLDAPPDEPLTTDVLGLLDRLGLTPPETDLILDLGAVTDAAESGKTALAALDLLGAAARWRTVVLTSGAFPRLHDSSDLGPVLLAHRHDRGLHEAVRAARPDFQGRLLYGDYSIEHAFSANIPHIRGSGPPWGLMRYTAPDAYLLGRVPTRDTDRTDRIHRVRAMARRIVGSEAFRGRAYSDSERWLQDCADGEGSKGSGNPATWIRVGHVQHMTFVVRGLLDGRA